MFFAFLVIIYTGMKDQQHGFAADDCDFNPRTHEECDQFEFDMATNRVISIHALV